MMPIEMLDTTRTIDANDSNVNDQTVLGPVLIFNSRRLRSEVREGTGNGTLLKRLQAIPFLL